MATCLKKYQASETPRVGRFAGNLPSYWDGLFTFLYNEDVEPNNNIAEQAARSPVMWRRICQGNKTEQGAWVTERLLTVIHTCRMQGRHRIDFLTEAITAHRIVLPAPSLLPRAENQIKLVA